VHTARALLPIPDPLIHVVTARRSGQWTMCCARGAGFKFTARAAGKMLHRWRCLPIAA